MATHKAEYYKLNGDTWDKYYFKTTVDMVEGLAPTYGGTNLAVPDLEDKEYLGDGNYLLFSERGLTLSYNVFTGIFTREGTLVGGSFEFPLLFNLQANQTVTISPYLSTEGNVHTQIWEKPDRMLLGTGNNSFTFTTSSQFQYIFLNFNGVSGIEQFKLQLEKGDTATPYTLPTPFVLPHELTQLATEDLVNAKIADKVDNNTLNKELSQVFGGKNLVRPQLEGKEYLGNGLYRFYNKNGITIDYNVYSGIWTFNGQSTDNLVIRYSNTNLVGEVITATNYIIERNNSNIITSMITIGSGNSRRLYYSNNINTITTEVDYNYNTFYISSNDVFDNFTFKLQLEKGSQATPYTLPTPFVLPHEAASKDWVTANTRSNEWEPTWKYIIDKPTYFKTTVDMVEGLTPTYGGTNLAVPKLTDKPYLGNGIYKLYERSGGTLTYNVYTGEYRIFGRITGGFDYQFGYDRPHPDNCYIQIWKTDQVTWENGGNIIGFGGGTYSQVVIDKNTDHDGKIPVSNDAMFISLYQVQGDIDVYFKLQLEQGTTETPYVLPSPFVLPHEAASKDWVSANTRSNLWKPTWEDVKSKPSKLLREVSFFGGVMVVETVTL